MWPRRRIVISAFYILESLFPTAFVAAYVSG